MTATCGRPPSIAYAWYDHESRSWKTFQALLLSDTSHESLETFPKSGTTRDGQLFPRPRLVHATYANDSGLWPTVRSSDSERGGRGDLLQAVRGNENKHFKFPTVRANEAGGYQFDKGDRSKKRPTLTGVVRLFPTPQAHDATPGDAARVGRFGTKHGGRNLNDDIAMFPTPTVQDSENNGGPSQYDRDTIPLNAFVKKKGSSAQLNADWTEWLMGWPIGWTALIAIKVLRCEPLSIEPSIPRVIKGQQQRRNRIKAIGNGWVPQCAVHAWRLLTR